MTVITCACGNVRLEADGAPILSPICHCTSCRTAGQSFDAMSGQHPIVDQAGGTALVLWRKDRVRCVAGADLLEPHRLMESSPTRRFVAACCKSPMFLDFTKGFWVSIFRDRVPDAPPPSMRVMTGHTPPELAIPDDGLTHFRTHSGRFMFKLMTTWARLGFRTPKIAGVPDS